jgi:hypothetical protein
MPSLQHEALLELFRNRPLLAPELLRDALQIELPEYSEARIGSADLNQLQPTEYHADLVVLLLDDKPVLGIVVEVQLQPDERKEFVWPAYVATLRARLECSVVLLVITPNENTAGKASRSIDLGGGNVFRPLVLGPSGVPIVTDEAVARADPELAVLSAMSHGKDPDAERAAKIAAAAQAAASALAEDRGSLYYDLIYHALSEAARKALQDMAIPNYQYQSDFARHYFAQGEARGEARGEAKGERHGRAELLARQLAQRFGLLPESAKARLAQCSIAELDAIGERVLSAADLPDVFNGAEPPA